MTRFLIILWLLFPIFGWANVTVHQLDDDVSFWLKTVPSSNTVSIRVSFLGGDFHDPKEKEGLVRLATDMLWAGTKQRPEVEFLNALDDGSISLDFWTSDAYFHGSIYGLKSEISKAVGLMFEAMLEPSLLRASLKKEKQNITAHLKEQDLQPDHQFNVFMNEIIARDQPFFQRLATIKTIGRIKQKDLKKYYENTFAKEHMAITVTGNITAEEVKQLLAPYISKLPQKSGFEMPEITLEPRLDGEQHIFEQDVQQASIIWLQKAIHIQDPAIYAALLFDEWLGGAGGILTKEIREKQGLTYHISTDLQAGQFYQLYIGQMATDNKAIKTVIHNIQTIWRQIKDDNQNQQGEFYLSEQDLKRLKQRFASAWSISFINNAAVNNQLMSFLLTGYDEYFMERFVEQIQNVSHQDMQDFIEEFLQPEALTFFIMSNEIN